MSKIDDVIMILKNRINEGNIHESILSAIKILNEKGKDATKYAFTDTDGTSLVLKKKLGANRLEDWKMGEFLSSDREFISDNIKINVTGGLLSEKTNSTTGDFTEAYENLVRRIQSFNSTSFENIMKEVYFTTRDYFGGIELLDEKERTMYYEQLGSTNEVGKMSDMKGRNIAACVERAALSQNLLKFLGLDSVYKISQITVGGKNELHAYNLVAHKGKYYIFDSTIPRITQRGEITPIIAEIPKDVFETLSHPFFEDDVSVRTETDSFKGHKTIHYNSWSENVFDVVSKTNDSNDDPQL